MRSPLAGMLALVCWIVCGALPTHCLAALSDDPFFRSGGATRLPSVELTGAPAFLSEARQVSYNTPASLPTVAAASPPGATGQFVAYGAPPADCNCNGDCAACPCEDIGNWWHNTLFSFGGEAWKSFTNGSFNAGLVGTWNTGFHLWRELRGQIGMSYGVYDFGTEDFSFSQGFLTAGVYRRSDVAADKRWSFGVVDDVWFTSDATFVQLRGIVGYATSEWNEFGLWGTIALSEKRVNSFPIPRDTLRPINQINGFWRRNFAFGGQGMLYFGGLDQGSSSSWVFGWLGQAPLSDNLGLYGGFVFVQPSDNQPRPEWGNEWNLTFGLTWFVGGNAVSPTVSGRQGLPLLPVANNGSLLISD